MANRKRDKQTQTSFLISLILHAILALVLGFIIIEHSQEEAAESVGVYMISPTQRTKPPRRNERRDVLRITPGSPSTRKAQVQFEPRPFDQVDIDFTQQPQSSDPVPIVPELTTRVEKVRARIGTVLPRATGAEIAKPSSGGGGPVGGGKGAGSVGISPEAGLIETALYWIARNTARQNKTGKEDIVFLIDASGTMEDNIIAVARYISKMIDVFKESDLNYTMGVVRFNRVLKENDVKVYEQTPDVDKVKRILRSIKCDGDERTFDAIEIGLTQVDFRNPVDKTFILVTDEAFTPRTSTRQIKKEWSRGEMVQTDFQEILSICQADGVKVNVLGIEDSMHKGLAKQTGGLWFQIPQQNGMP